MAKYKKIKNIKEERLKKTGDGWLLDIIGDGSCKRLETIPQQSEVLVDDQSKIRPISHVDWEGDNFPESKMGKLIGPAKKELGQMEQILVHDTTTPNRKNIMENGFDKGSSKDHDKGTPRHRATYFHISKEDIKDIIGIGFNSTIAAIVPIEDVVIAKTGCADPLARKNIGSNVYNEYCTWTHKEYIKCLKKGYKDYNTGIKDVLPYKAGY